MTQVSPNSVCHAAARADTAPSEATVPTASCLLARCASIDAPVPAAPSGRVSLAEAGAVRARAAVEALAAALESPRSAPGGKLAGRVAVDMVALSVGVLGSIAADAGRPLVAASLLGAAMGLEVASAMRLGPERRTRVAVFYEVTPLLPLAAAGLSLAAALRCRAPCRSEIHSNAFFVYLILAILWRGAADFHLRGRAQRAASSAASNLAEV